ncbi:hypothetical protein B7494_g5975 [Chlorociboria aeruginascens]|nr:hypothetical protein B7494_g5975 [Chlorociboria aeruginascens]
MPFFETIDKSDILQLSFPYDFNSHQDSLDSWNLNSLSFFSTDVSHTSFPQVTDLSMPCPVFDSYDAFSYKPTIETDQSDEVALLRSDVERLKDVVQTLQPGYNAHKFFYLLTALANPFQNNQRDDNSSNSSIRSRTHMEIMTCADTFRDEVLSMSAQPEKATCERDNLESRLRGIEDYLPSLGLVGGGNNTK